MVSSLLLINLQALGVRAQSPFRPSGTVHVQLACGVILFRPILQPAVRYAVVNARNSSSAASRNSVNVFAAVRDFRAPLDPQL